MNTEEVTELLRIWQNWLGSCREACDGIGMEIWDRIDAVLEEPEKDELEEMRKRKDAAYEERNRVVAALAKLFPSGIAKTAIEGWSEEWHGCVYIDLPTGQVSWHFHDSQAYLFEGLPEYTKSWDGHNTEEKYRRLFIMKPQTISVKTFSEEEFDQWVISKCLYSETAQAGARLAFQSVQPEIDALKKTLIYAAECSGRIVESNTALFRENATLKFEMENLWKASQRVVNYFDDPRQACRIEDLMDYINNLRQALERKS